MSSSIHGKQVDKTQAYFQTNTYTLVHSAAQPHHNLSHRLRRCRVQQTQAPTSPGHLHAMSLRNFLLYPDTSITSATSNLKQGFIDVLRWLLHPNSLLAEPLADHTQVQLAPGRLITGSASNGQSVLQSGLLTTCSFHLHQQVAPRGIALSFLS